MSTGRKVAIITGASQGIGAALVKVGSLGEQLDATSRSHSGALVPHRFHYFAVQIAARHILSGSIRADIDN
jgi:NAD(P)-dependent dehydrogenase (short-subunit alcohol dehydrogenase family)